MGVTGHSGIIVRQAGNRLITRAHLLDSAGNRVTSGTCNLRLAELQDDGALKTYDFADNTFKSGAVTTATAAMTHRTMENGTQNTGLWTHVLSTLTGFTAGAIYFAAINHTGAAPTWQEIEFQYGGGEGADLNVANTTSNDATTVAGQIRRTHALVGGTKSSQDHAATNAPIKHRNEADNADLLTITPGASGTTSTFTPS